MEDCLPANPPYELGEYMQPDYFTIENTLDDLKNDFSDMIENDPDYKQEFYDKIILKLHHLRIIADKINT